MGYLQDIQSALTRCDREQFTTAVRNYLCNAKAMNQLIMVTYDPASEQQTHLADTLVMLSNSYGVNGNAVGAYAKNDNFASLSFIRMQVQDIVNDLKSWNYDEAREEILRILRSARVFSELTVVNMPIYYSACDKYQTRFRGIMQLAEEEVPANYGIYCCLYAKQKAFIPDAIARFKSLDNVPRSVWRNIPEIHSCYGQLFSWYYQQQKEIPEWGQIVQNSMYGITYHNNEWWVDVLSTLHSYDNNFFMPAVEWNFIINNFIVKNITDVSMLGVFDGGSVDPARTIYSSRREYNAVTYDLAMRLLNC